MAAALLGLGRIKGIDRPAIAGVLPNVKGFTVLLDIEQILTASLTISYSLA